MNQHIEDYLKELHAKDYHGVDDDMPDAYDAWLTELQADDWIKILADFEATIRESERDKLLQNTFVLTDSCMWEANAQAGTRSEHYVEVVDDKTGQVRFIASGSRIKFIEGNISNVHTQEGYKEQQKALATLSPSDILGDKK
jgi:hypothetical protein